MMMGVRLGEVAVVYNLISRLSGSFRLVDEL